MKNNRLMTILAMFFLTLLNAGGNEILGAESPSVAACAAAVRPLGETGAGSVAPLGAEVALANLGSRLANSQAAIISGPRSSGKSMVIEQFARSLEASSPGSPLKGAQVVAVDWRQIENASPRQTPGAEVKHPATAIGEAVEAELKKNKDGMLVVVVPEADDLFTDEPNSTSSVTRQPIRGEITKLLSNSRVKVIFESRRQNILNRIEAINRATAGLPEIHLAPLNRDDQALALFQFVRQVNHTAGFDIVSMDPEVLDALMKSGAALNPEFPLAGAKTLIKMGQQKLERQEHALDLVAKTARLKNLTELKDFGGLKGPAQKEFEDLTKEVQGLNKQLRSEEDLIAEIKKLNQTLVQKRTEHTQASRSSPGSLGGLKAEIKSAEEQLREKLAQLSQIQGAKPLVFWQIDQGLVKTITAEATGKKAGTSTKLERADSLEEALLAKVIGQNQAIGEVAKDFVNYAAGNTPADQPNKPPVFLFIGPSGAGKTFTAQNINRHMNEGNQSAMVFVDGGEMGGPHAPAARLVGAPPGYVGYTPEGGLLTKAVRASAGGFVVVVIDEVEKADIALQDVLLGIFDRGEMADHEGKPLKFEGAIILTSNAAQDIISESIRRVGHIDDAAYGRIVKVLEEGFPTADGKTYRFRPELLNRLRIVIFQPNSAPKEMMAKAVEKLNKRQIFAEHGRTVELSKEVLELVQNNAWNNEQQARGVESWLNDFLMIHVSKAEAKGKLKSAAKSGQGSHVKFEVVKDKNAEGKDVEMVGMFIDGKLEKTLFEVSKTPKLARERANEALANAGAAGAGSTRDTVAKVLLNNEAQFKNGDGSILRTLDAGLDDLLEGASPPQETFSPSTPQPQPQPATQPVPEKWTIPAPPAPTGQTIISEPKN